MRLHGFSRRFPQKRSEELTLEEIEKIFLSMGHIYVFNISGGEPFLRRDLFDIIVLACKHLTPGIIHIPTNAIAADRVEKCVRRILAFLADAHPGVRLTIKPSLDHIGQKHDEIRGVPGNFQKAILLFEHLKPLETDYPNFHLELGTVISRWNVDDIAEIARFVTSWTSARARTVRQFIRLRRCHCPLANQTYSNILMHGLSLLKVLRHILRPTIS